MLRRLLVFLLGASLCGCGSSPSPSPEPGPRSAEGPTPADPRPADPTPSDPRPEDPEATSDPAGDPEPERAPPRDPSDSDPAPETTDPRDPPPVDPDPVGSEPDPVDPIRDPETDPAVDPVRPPPVEEPPLDPDPDVLAEPPDLSDILSDVLDPDELAEPVSIHADLDRLLQRHVRDQRVDYLLLRRDDWEILLGYLGRMAQVDLDAMNPRERLAYWINLYNASMIRAVGERLRAGYSPAADDYGIFKEESIASPEGRISLDAVENSIVRPRFKEARIHVALVCGARSCPPLIPEAYEAARLEAQLQANMVAFVQDRARNQVDPATGRMQLSQLFNWYAEDFGGKDGVVDYVDRFHPAELSAGKVDGFLEYSWELNIAPPREGRWISLRTDTPLLAVPKGRRLAEGRAGQYFEVKDTRPGWLQLGRLDGEGPVWVEEDRAAAF